MTFEYPEEVVCERGRQDRLQAGRIRHVRDLCQGAIERDQGVYPGNSHALTDRQWLAQSVLNILDGKIDAQIVDEDK